jgi:hypothetical protein
MILTKVQIVEAVQNQTGFTKKDPQNLLKLYLKLSKAHWEPRKMF